MKVRCPYCEGDYDEQLMSCPHCGASKRESVPQLTGAQASASGFTPEFDSIIRKRQKKKARKKKRSAAIKIGLPVLALIVVAAALLQPSADKAGKDEAALPAVQQEKGIIGKDGHKVEIVSARVEKDKYGKSLVVTYKWTNNKSEETCFSECFQTEVYLDGVHCTNKSSTSLTSLNADTGTKIKPEKTLEVAYAYYYNPRSGGSGKVEVEVEAFRVFGKNKTKVVREFYLDTGSDID